MNLTPQQRHEINNIITSTEMECGPLDDITKDQIELIITGEISVEEAASSAIEEARNRDHR